MHQIGAGSDRDGFVETRGTGTQIDPDGMPDQHDGLLTVEQRRRTSVLCGECFVLLQPRRPYG